MRALTWHGRRRVGLIVPPLSGDDHPLGTGDQATHRLPPEQAPHGYEILQRKQDGAIKVLLNP